MIRALVWMALLAAGAYISALYAAPRVRAWRFRDAMTQTVRLADASNEEAMRESLIESAGDLGIPLATRRLSVSRGEPGDARIAASWEEVVRVRAWKLGEWVDTLHFAYEVRERSR